MTAPVIQSERLTLDAITPADTDAVLEFCLDPELQRYTRIPVPYTRADAEFFTGPYAIDAEHGTSVRLWAIRVDGAFAGTIELRLDTSGSSAELGYWIGTPFRGRGVMTEALGLVVACAFDDLGLTTLHWDAVAGNRASAAVARATGFTFLGTRPSHIAIRAELHDAWIAELNAGDPRQPTDGWPL